MLSSELIEDRITNVDVLNPEWGLGNGHYYGLNLKMCQLNSLEYAFAWGTYQNSTEYKVRCITEAPGRIIDINLSLNELRRIHGESLEVFVNLRRLDISLNRLHDITGLHVLHHLHSLDLSHNALVNLAGLEECTALQELKLSVNELNNISAVSSLVNLRMLSVDNNLLHSLNGVQHLPKLQELYAQRNSLTAITEIGACLNIKSVNAADNQICDLPATLDVVSHLHHLASLSLYGNPIEHERSYKGDITHLTSVVCLDNVTIKQPHRHMERDASTKHSDNLTTLQDVTKAMFHEQIARERRKMEGNIAGLQTKIVKLRQGFSEYEAQVMSDMERCHLYLESLSNQELDRLDHIQLRRDLFSPSTKPWNLPESPKRRNEPKVPSHDYKNVRNTDEILRCAYNELAKDAMQF